MECCNSFNSGKDEEFEARIELGLTGQVMVKASTITYEQETSTYIKHMSKK